MDGRSRIDSPTERRRIADELVDALVEIHAVEWRRPGSSGLGKPTGYLERQVRRFSGLWEVNATRELPLVGEVAACSRRSGRSPGRPRSCTATTGSATSSSPPQARLAPRAVLDWELATIGDPLADVGVPAVDLDESRSRSRP